MKPVPTTNEFPQLREGGDIPTPSPLREVLASMPQHQWRLLVSNLRLDLQSRVSSLEDRDLIKLQGKLEYLGELDNFILLLLK